MCRRGAAGTITRFDTRQGDRMILPGAGPIRNYDGLYTVAPLNFEKKDR